MVAFITGKGSLTAQLIDATGTTLFYSLWLGMACAVVTGLLLAATRNTCAAVRYNLLTANLLLFAAGSGLVFILQLQREHQAATVDSMGTLSRQFSAAIILNNNKAALMNYLNAHNTTIVLTWLLVICFKSAYLGIGIRSLYRMRSIQVRPAVTYWQDMLASLSGQLQIRTTIGLLESGLAGVPMVIGFFKPVILIPIGLFTNLSAQEVEAILLHELAHIRRRDFLVSLLQNLLEILFFFNPAVWWLSYLIRREREHCCDDLVIAQTGHRINYIRALFSCQAYQPDPSAYAITLFSNKKQLLRRVKRMTETSGPVFSRLEKIGLGVCLASVICFFAAFSGPSRSVAIRTTKEMPRLIYYRTPDGRTGIINRDTLTWNKAKDDPDQAMLRKLTDELTAEKRIAGLKALDGLKLNDAVFEINGQTLPEALRRQYKSKYLPQAGYGIYYGNVHFSGRGTFIIIPKIK